jgi:hypothetical protein
MGRAVASFFGRGFRSLFMFPATAKYLPQGGMLNRLTNRNPLDRDIVQTTVGLDATIIRQFLFLGAPVSDFPSIQAGTQSVLENVQR